MQAKTVHKTVVITDTNVLINFMHINQMSLLVELPAYRFGLPIEVLHELTEVQQKNSIETAIERKEIDLLVIETMDALALFGELRDLMGRGEAACLALAATAGFYIASDEKKRFRSKAVELISAERILRTEDLLLEAIRCGHITVTQADAHKTLLANNRYTMPFASFAECL